VFRSVVGGGNSIGVRLRTPAADIDAVLCREQPGVAHVILVGPSRGTMQVLGILREFACSAVCEDEENANAEKTPCEDDHFSFEERPANPLILRSAIAPSHGIHEKGWLDAARLRPQNRRAKCRLILEPSGDVLSGDENSLRRAEGIRALLHASYTRRGIQVCEEYDRVPAVSSHGRASSSFAVLRLSALSELTDSALESE